MADQSPFLEVGAADILRLIQGYLTSAGLHESNRVLREESGIGAAGVPHRMLKTWSAQGKWGLVLRSLSILDRDRCRLDVNLIAQVHEIAILELAAANDFEVAYAAYRFAQSDLEASQVRLPGTKEKISRSRHVEQKLAALAAARAKDPNAPIPNDFYDGRSRDDVRKELGERLDIVPEQPSNRLTSLIQQAIKYQSFTGELPQIKELYSSKEEEEESGASGHNKKKRRKVFDLVLGTTSLDSVEDVVVGETIRGRLRPAEPIPSKPFATIKFGKKAVCESATFMPDGAGLVTGSSDGLIEIWDAAQNYGELRRDLPYQMKDELLGHDVAVTALAVTNDGTMLASGDLNGKIYVWRIDTGTCLCIMQCHSAAISCIQFSPSGSHILTAGQDSKCREFGLRTSKMLKEFTGHDSFVNSCFYCHHPTAGLRVITGSADGKVRIFDGSTAECLAILRPPGVGEDAREGVSIAMETSGGPSAHATNAAIACIVPLHTPAQSMVVVARSSTAVLVNHSGVVLRIFQDDASSHAKSFCAATASPSNRFLFAAKEDGTLSVFDIESGKLEASIYDFGAESTGNESKHDGSKGNAEIACLVNHPFRSMIAAFSNDKAQKRGKLVVWK
ncbi:hypothetical protein ACA910_016120 [Epithemia clementina (nom. ined.)]